MSNMPISTWHAQALPWLSTTQKLQGSSVYLTQFPIPFLSFQNNLRDLDEAIQRKALPLSKHSVNNWQ